MACGVPVVLPRSSRSNALLLLESNKEENFKMASEAVVILPSENHPVNTERATRQSVKLFYYFLAEKEIPEPEDASSLREVLKTFYLQAKKTDGSLYSKSSLQSLRYGLCRHFKLTFGVDIINDLYFKEANNCYQSRCIFLKNQGLDQPDHRPPFPENDIRKLYQSGVFSLESPRTLQNKVFFEIVLFFCRRRKQNPRDLRASDFEFRVDRNGRRYACRSGHEVPDGCQETEEERELSIMYERGGPFCPVNSLELYMKRLCPDNPILFQKPKKDQFASSDIWYENVAYGERALAEKMKKITTEAGLSQQFVTHSARITSISRWSKCLFGSCCSRVASKAVDRAGTSRTVDELAGGNTVTERKVSERVSESRDGSTLQQENQDTEDSHQQTQHPKKVKKEDENVEWLEHKCKSGQVLLVKIAEKPSEKMVCSISTQTDDTNCTNGCTSKFVSFLPQEFHPASQTTSTVHKSTRSIYTEKGKGKKEVEEDKDVIMFEDSTIYDSDSDIISDTESHGTQSYASDLSAVLRVLENADDIPENITSTSSNKQRNYQRSENLVSESTSCSLDCRSRERNAKRHCEEGVKVCHCCGKNNPPQDSCNIGDAHKECDRCQDHSSIRNHRKSVEQWHEVTNNGHEQILTRRRSDECTYQHESDKEHVGNAVYQNSAALRNARAKSVECIDDDCESLNDKIDDGKSDLYCSKNDGFQDSADDSNESCRHSEHSSCENWQAYLTSVSNVNYQPFICKQRNREVHKSHQQLEPGTEKHAQRNKEVHKNCQQLEPSTDKHASNSNTKEESQGFITKFTIAKSRSNEKKTEVPYQNGQLNQKDEKDDKQSLKVYCTCTSKFSEEKGPVNENKDSQHSQLVMRAKQTEPRRKASFTGDIECTGESQASKKQKLESPSTIRCTNNDNPKTTSTECLETVKDADVVLIDD